MLTYLSTSLVAMLLLAFATTPKRKWLSGGVIATFCALYAAVVTTMLNCDGEPSHASQAAFAVTGLLFLWLGRIAVGDAIGFIRARRQVT